LECAWGLRKTLDELQNDALIVARQISPNFRNSSQLWITGEAPIDDFIAFPIAPVSRTVNGLSRFPQLLLRLIFAKIG